VNGLKGDKGDAGLSGPQGPSVSTAKIVSNQNINLVYMHSLLSNSQSVTAVDN